MSDLPVLDLEVVAMNPVFGRLGDLVVRDSVLWVLDNSGDPFVHAIHRGTGERLISRGPPGDGPGDFRSASSVHERSGSESVIIFDVTAGRLTRVYLDPSSRLRESDVVQLPRVPSISRLASFGSGYVGLTRDSLRRFVFLDSTGSIVRSAAGELLGSVTAPYRQRLLASIGVSMCSRPDAAMFAVAYTAAGRIEVRDSVGSLLDLAQVQDSSSGEFVRNERDELVWKRTRTFFRDCVGTDRAVFAIFSGERADEVDSLGRFVSTGGGATLEVYAWTGALIARYALPVFASKIAFSDDLRTIYLASLQDATIYRSGNPLFESLTQ